jgi:hypothetical protein
MAERDAVVEWLLEPDNPPVRYLTLTRLLGRPSSDPEVRKAKARLGDYQPTREILSRLEEYLNDDERAYQKYNGKYWQLIFLGQFLAPSDDPRVRRLVEDILSKPKWVSSTGGQCLTANIVAAATRLGFGDHPVVLEQREALARRINVGKGLDCAVMAYSLLSRCQMAQPKVLLCLSQVEARDRSKAIRSAIDWLVKNLLANEVFVYVPGGRKQWQRILEHQPKAADLPKGETVKRWISAQREVFLAKHGLGQREPKAGWLKFGFPLHYNSDVLEATYALALAGVAYTKQLEKAIAAVRQGRNSQGVWVMESSLNGKMLADVETKGQPSKWLTYFARFALQHFER